MAEDAPSFRAVFERDPIHGAWLVRVEGLDGCHTYGRTKLEATKRIEEALVAWLDQDPSEFTLTHG
jgi:predicted RNase H-like HicB family nuclease